MTFSNALHLLRVAGWLLLALICSVLALALG